MKGRRKRSLKRQGAEETDPKATDWSPVGRERIIAKISDLIEPLCEAEGLELVHIEYQGEASGRILRLYIDKVGGVTIDDGVRISRQTRDILDVYLENTGSYSLEVSSPGPNRPLSKKSDYDKFEGRQAKIRTAQPIEGQKNFKGVLAGVSAESVNLSVEGTILSIPFKEIARAQLVGE